MCKDYSDIRQSNQPTLRDMQGSRNLTAYALTYISAAIMNYLDFVNRKELMSENQIAETAMLILESKEFQMLKLDDFVLFVRKAKMGDFGNLYTLNGTTIIEWLREYRNMRSWNLHELDEQEENASREAEWAAYDPNDPKVKAAAEHCLKRIEEYQTQVADALDLKKRQARELSEKDKVEKLRLKVIKDNAYLLRTDPDHAFEITEQRIYEALVKAGLPADSCNIQSTSK